MTLSSFTVRSSTGGSKLRDPDGLTSALRSDPTADPAEFDGRAGEMDLRAMSYTEVEVTWRIPAALAFTDMVIVRSAYGTPVTQHDGVLVHRNTSVYVGSFVDTVPEPGRWYYYAIFLRLEDETSPPWTLRAQNDVLVPNDHASHRRMMERIPATYRIQDDNLTSGAEGPLSAFLRMVGFELDIATTWADSLQWARDGRRLSSRLLEVAGATLGFRYEPSVGDARYRTLVEGGLGIRKGKGTPASIRSYVQALTGYASTVSIGKNLILDRDDGEALYDIGRWYLTNPTTYFFERQEGGGYAGTAFWKTTTLASGAAQIMLGDSDNILSMIPITAGTTYTWSFAERSASGSRLRSVTAYVRWFTLTGEELTRSDGTPTTDTTAWSVFSVTDTAPDGAAFALPGFEIAAQVTTEIHYFSAPQFEEGLSVTNWQSPRACVVTIAPQRANFIKNPTFAVDTTYWTTSGTDTETVADNTYSYTSATGDVELVSALFDVNPDYDYYAAAQISCPDGGTVTFSWDWWSDDATPVYVSTTDGDPITGSTGVARLSVSAVSPPAGTAFGKLRIIFSDATSGTVSQVLVERDQLGDYFDGETDTGALNDFRWAGEANASYSLYNLNLLRAAKRLEDALLNYVPYGITPIITFDYLDEVPLALEATVAPSSAVVTTGGATAFAASAIGGTSPYTYQWFEDSVVMADETDALLELASVSAAASYACEVTDFVGRVATSNTATVSVIDPLTLTVEPVSAAGTSGVALSPPLSVTVTGGVGTKTYQWYEGARFVDTTPVGTNASTYAPTITATKTYWCKITDSAGSVVYSTAATVTIPASTPLDAGPITMLPVSGIINDGDAVVMSITPSGGTPGYHYQWYAGALGVTTTPVGTDASTYEVSPTATTTYWCKVTDSAATPATDNSDAAVTVTVLPAAADSYMTPSVVIDSGKRMAIKEAKDGTIDTTPDISVPHTKNSIDAQWLPNGRGLCLNVNGELDVVYKKFTAIIRTPNFALLMGGANGSFHTWLATFGGAPSYTPVAGVPAFWIPLSYIYGGDASQGSNDIRNGVGDTVCVNDPDNPTVAWYVARGRVSGADRYGIMRYYHSGSIGTVNASTTSTRLTAIYGFPTGSGQKGPAINQLEWAGTSSTGLLLAAATQRGPTTGDKGDASYSGLLAWYITTVSSGTLGTATKLNEIGSFKNWAGTTTTTGGIGALTDVLGVSAIRLANGEIHGTMTVGQFDAAKRGVYYFRITNPASLSNATVQWYDISPDLGNTSNVYNRTYSGGGSDDKADPFHAPFVLDGSNLVVAMCNYRRPSHSSLGNRRIKSGSGKPAPAPPYTAGTAGTTTADYGASYLRASIPTTGTVPAGSTITWTPLTKESTVEHESGALYYTGATETDPNAVKVPPGVDKQANYLAHSGDATGEQAVPGGKTFKASATSINPSGTRLWWAGKGGSAYCENWRSASPKWWWDANGVGNISAWRVVLMDDDASAFSLADRDRGGVSGRIPPNTNIRQPFYNFERWYGSQTYSIDGFEGHVILGTEDQVDNSGVITAQARALIVLDPHSNSPKGPGNTGGPDLVVIGPDNKVGLASASGYGVMKGVGVVKNAAGTRYLIAVTTRGGVHKAAYPTLATAPARGDFSIISSQTPSNEALCKVVKPYANSDYGYVVIPGKYILRTTNGWGALSNWITLPAIRSGGDYDRITDHADVNAAGTVMWATSASSTNRIYTFDPTAQAAASLTSLTSAEGTLGLPSGKVWGPVAVCKKTGTVVAITLPIDDRVGSPNPPQMWVRLNGTGNFVRHCEGQQIFESCGGLFSSIDIATDTTANKTYIAISTDSAGVITYVIGGSSGGSGGGEVTASTDLLRFAGYIDADGVTSTDRTASTIRIVSTAIRNEFVRVATAVGCTVTTNYNGDPQKVRVTNIPATVGLATQDVTWDIPTRTAQCLRDLVALPSPTASQLSAIKAYITSVIECEGSNDNTTPYKCNDSHSSAYTDDLVSAITKVGGTATRGTGADKDGNPLYSARWSASYPTKTTWSTLGYFFKATGRLPTS